MLKIQDGQGDSKTFYPEDHNNKRRAKKSNQQQTAQSRAASSDYVRPNHGPEVGSTAAAIRKRWQEEQQKEQERQSEQQAAQRLQTRVEIAWIAQTHPELNSLYGNGAELIKLMLEFYPQAPNGGGANPREWAFEEATTELVTQRKVHPSDKLQGFVKHKFNQVLNYSYELYSETFNQDSQQTDAEEADTKQLATAG